MNQEDRLVLAWELFISHFDCACRQIKKNKLKTICFDIHKCNSLQLKGNRYFALDLLSKTTIKEVNPIEILVSGKMKYYHDNLSQCIEDFYGFAPVTIGAHFHKAFSGKPINFVSLMSAHRTISAGYWIGLYFRAEYGETSYSIDVPPQLQTAIKKIEEMP
jgi:hypothetical protein